MSNHLHYKRFAERIANFAVVVQCQLFGDSMFSSDSAMGKPQHANREDWRKKKETKQNNMRYSYAVCTYSYTIILLSWNANETTNDLRNYMRCIQKLKCIFQGFMLIYSMFVNLLANARALCNFYNSFIPFNRDNGDVFMMPSMHTYAFTHGNINALALACEFHHHILFVTQ